MPNCSIGHLKIFGLPNRYGKGAQILQYGFVLRQQKKPTSEDAKAAISRAKIIMGEFENNPDVSSYVKEAKEVHAKILQSLED